MIPILARLAWLVLLLSCALVHAQAPVPAPLEPWRGWVLADKEYRSCPLIAGAVGQGAEDFLCAWPGVLRIVADGDGADLVQRWQVDAESWLPLAGDADHWPQQVRLDGQAAIVVDHGGPALRVQAGSHEIHARIPWTQRPQRLRVPDAIGLVELVVDGRAVVPLQRGGDQLTLGRGDVAAADADALRVRVYRRLQDGIPAELTTRIEIDVSGQAREERIGPVLADGFLPLALDADWPARLDADGYLRVQVQPGGGTLTLTARSDAPLATVTARLPAAPWPDQEIWSYAAAPQLRVTNASGAVQVDPAQAEVPAGWRGLPAFALSDGDEIVIEERSRGASGDEANRLTLAREMWLDFNGDGWYARDAIGGTMLRGWRFDVAAPFVLEHAAAGEDALLVTRGAAPATSGVEWRTPAVDLRAGLRVTPDGAALPIAGWLDSFERITTILHLPPGYRLLAAPGADSAAGSWLSAWTLLDVFIAAILALVAWRWFGLVGTLVVIAYLLLGYQEPGAPLWSLLFVLALALTVRALPAGRLATVVTWLRGAALLVLVIIALPFVANQLRLALYPQLEAGSGTYAAGSVMTDRDATERRKIVVEEAMPMAVPAPPAPPASPASMALDSTAVTGSRVRPDDIDRYTEGTVVQTGGGMPSWQLGRDYTLAWNGPVVPAQSVRLVIAPSWLVRQLRVVLVALLAWLIVRLAQPVARELVSRRASTVLVAALAWSGFGAPPPAVAQGFPSTELLDELRTELTQSPDCAPSCAAIANAGVSAAGDEIRIALEAHALAPSALPLPGGDHSATLLRVLLDGAEASGVARHDGQRWVALDRGVHRVELVYTPLSDTVALAFPMKPARVEFAGDGWRANGIASARLLTDTVNLVRVRATSVGAPTDAAQQFAPFVRVTRSLDLGLDWNVTTEVTRLAPAEGGFTVRVPLLSGERVASAGVEVEDGRVIAAIGENASLTIWKGTLDQGDALRLTAPELTEHAEVWRVRVGPTWHVAFSGVPVNASDAGDDADAYRTFEFHPLPGETLSLAITRPAAAQGASRAIDALRLDTAIGERARTTTLDIDLRTSQGGEQTIRLPADAELVGASRDGEALNLRLDQGKLSLPLVPGSQTFELRFRDATPIGFLASTPDVDPGLPAANIDLQIELPADRWLLLTRGPLNGPAVLYWGELAVMLLIAWGLARTRRTSLKLWQWVLLGIGFSTFSWVALVVVVAWLFALDARARVAPPRSDVAFNLMQIGLAVLTFAALCCVAAAIPQGLLGTPDMHVVGNGSSPQSLHWFADRSSGALPAATAISLPLWAYKLAMLAWALWLANALVGWLRRGFAAWMQGGYWRKPQPPMIDTRSAPPPPPPPGG